MKGRQAYRPFIWGLVESLIPSPSLPAQMYGKHRCSSDIKERYMASCMEALLGRLAIWGGIRVYVC